jgi:hypothetical protein
MKARDERRSRCTKSDMLEEALKFDSDARCDQCSSSADRRGSSSSPSTQQGRERACALQFACDAASKQIETRSVRPIGRRAHCLS